MRGLLHRLADASSPGGLRPILANLHAILNTHQGDGYTCPEMGVDFVELLSRWPTSEHDVIASVAKTIERFEPRLRNVRVRVIERQTSAMGLALEILADFPGHDHVRMITELSRGGGVCVR